jgi:hypothetical protein
VHIPAATILPRGCYRFVRKLLGKGKNRPKERSIQPFKADGALAVLGGNTLPVRCPVPGKKEGSQLVVPRARNTVVTPQTFGRTEYPIHILVHDSEDVNT